MSPRPVNPPTARTVRKLQALLNRRRRLEIQCALVADELAVATLRASEEEGASRQQIAQALGVGTSTVQGWVDRGRQVVVRND